MKCLVLSCEYPPTKGGIANAAAAFAEAMVSRNWEIEVCTTVIYGEPSLRKISSVNVHRLQMEGDASIWNPLSGDIERFEIILRRMSPDVVVIHGWQSWCVRMLPLLREAGIPAILQSHGFGLHRVNWYPKPPFGLKVWVGYQPFIWCMPSFISSLFALVVLSRKPNMIRSFDHWLGGKADCNNIVTIPNSVASPKGTKKDFLSRHPNLIEKKIVLCVANYCDRKNQLAALDVIRKIDDPRSCLVLIGGEENEYTHRVRRKVVAMNLSHRVMVLSNISREHTESAIAACDVALMTSKFEMQPLFLLEAMAVGKPWVSTLVGSVNELEGGLISDNRSSSMASHVTRLFADTSLYADLARKGFEQWQNEYTQEVVYDKWNKLLLTVLSRKQMES
jgi:glycosyltransferase involved in cell wall biosynthesis